jgi:hypothetical protein
MKCDECKRAIGQGAAVYHLTVLCGADCFAPNDHRNVANLCANCAGASGNSIIANINGGWRSAEPCRNCGRPVINDRKPRGAKLKYVVCDDECRRAFHAARAKERRKPPMRACLSCGKQYEPKRTDARYCSAACKQRAHRARQGEKA